MNKLLLVRHGQSEGNSLGIIQGKTNYPLTDKGKTNVLNLVKDNYDLFKEYDNIIASPLTRAQETAKIISEYTDKQVTTDPLLEEFNAGILEGMKKSDAIKKYEEYYQIWTKRGDLDEIPGAELGDELQARVLMYLDKYLQTDSKDIIVSHAGTLRSLINTVYGRNRETPVSLDHHNIYTLEDVWKNIGINECHIAKSSRVFEIETYDKKYIMKRIDNKTTDGISEEIQLLNYLNQHINTPKILGTSKRDEYILKMMNYAEGINIHSNLNSIQIKNTIKELSKLKSVLEQYKYKDKYKECNILEEFHILAQEIKERDIRNIIKNILSNEKFINALEDDKVILVHDDLHRDNILYNQNNPIFLDFDGVMLAPSTYQLASHIAVNYLLYDSDFNISTVLDIWPEKVELEYLKGLIIFRILKGYNYFKKRIETGVFNDVDCELKNKYKKTLSKISK